MELTESLEVIHAGVVTSQVKEDVLESAGVSVRENEAITVGLLHVEKIWSIQSREVALSCVITSFLSIDYQKRSVPYPLSVLGVVVHEAREEQVGHWSASHRGTLTIGELNAFDISSPSFALSAAGSTTVVVAN